MSVRQAAWSTRLRSSSNPARPYMVRLIVFSRLICPSTGPVDHRVSSAARTAARSFPRPSAKPASGVPAAAASHPSSVPVPFFRTKAAKLRARLPTSARAGASANSRSRNARSGPGNSLGSAWIRRVTRAAEGGFQPSVAAGVGSSASGAARRRRVAHARTVDRPPSRPTAGSGDLLFERLDERAAAMVAQPALKLAGGELTVRLDHGPLAVHPLGLDRVQPRALARQPPDQGATPAAGGLAPPVVGPDPGADRAADVPGAVVPDQDQDPDVVGRHPLGHPGEEGAGDGADRPPRPEAQPPPLALGQPEAVAGERLRLGVVAVGRVHAQAERLARRPGVQRRLREAGEPDLVGEAEGPARPAPRQADQPVAPAFFCA